MLKQIGLITLMLTTNTTYGTMLDNIIQVNPALPTEIAENIVKSIYQYSTVYNVDPKLIAAIIATESGFKTNAVGGLGEIGLMQLRPEYHATYILNKENRRLVLFNIDANIKYGVEYVAALARIFDGYYLDKFQFIEHFNQGPNKTPKTFKYYIKVMSAYAMFNGGNYEPTYATNQIRGKNNRSASVSRKEVSGRNTRLTGSKNAAKRVSKPGRTPIA